MTDAESCSHHAYVLCYHSRMRMQSLLPCAAVLVGFTLMVGGFFPGCMGHDAYAQYVQVLSGRLYSHHPPMVAHVWGGMETILPGPAGMFLLHSAMYWVAVAWIMHRLLTRPWARALGILGFGLFPPLWLIMIQVGKDPSMLAAYLLAVAMLLQALHTPHRGWLAGAFLALLYGTLMRHNALSAGLPLLAFLSWLAVTHRGREDSPSDSANGCWKIITLKTGALTLLSTGLIALSASVVSSAGVRHIAVWPSIAVWDIAAISLKTDTMLLPDYVLRDPKMPLMRLRELFNETTNPPLCAHTPGVGREVLCREAWEFQYGGLASGGLDPADAPRITADWWRVITTHWPAYLAHRWRIFSYLVGLRTVEGYLPFAPRCMDSGDFGNADFSAYGVSVSLAHPERTHAIIDALLTPHDTPLYRGWTYVLLALGVVVWCVWRGPRNAMTGFAVTLAFSGLAYVAPLFFLTASLDFRYNSWLIASSLLAALCAYRASRQKPSVAV